MSPIIVPMNSSELLSCEKNARNSWTVKEKMKRDVFTRGCLGEDWLPVYYGFLGEVAFSKVIGIPSHTEYQPGGDRADFRIPIHADPKKYPHGRTVTIDVKLTTHRVCASESIAGYIRVQEASGKPVPTPFDFYVFCSIHREDQENRQAEIAINGYLRQEDLKQITRQVSSKDSHLNLVPRVKNLRDIRILIASIKQYGLEK